MIPLDIYGGKERINEKRLLAFLLLAEKFIKNVFSKRKKLFFKCDKIVNI